MALGLGLLCWITLLFSPLGFVQKVQADDSENYGTVIGIVRTHSPKRTSALRGLLTTPPRRISEPRIAALV